MATEPIIYDGDDEEIIHIQTEIDALLEEGNNLNDRLKRCHEAKLKFLELLAKCNHVVSPTVLSFGEDEVERMSERVDAVILRLEELDNRRERLLAAKMEFLQARDCPPQGDNDDQAGPGDKDNGGHNATEDAGRS